MPRSPAKSLTSTAASPPDTNLDPPRDAEELRSAGGAPPVTIGNSQQPAATASINNAADQPFGYAPDLPSWCCFRVVASTSDRREQSVARVDYGSCPYCQLWPPRSAKKRNWVWTASSASAAPLASAESLSRILGVSDALLSHR
jgi:hypothetical protein